MSRVITQDPLLLIENLLDAGIGEKGRLLYLRNYVKNGKSIYDSDRKFLERMQIELYQKNPEIFDNKNPNFLSEEEKHHISPSEPKISSFDQFENVFDNNTKYSSTNDSGITEILNMMDELKKSELRLKENFEHFLDSRKNFIKKNTMSLNPSIVIQKSIQNDSFQKTIVPLNSSIVNPKSIQNNSSQVTSLLQEVPKPSESKISRFTKYDAMAYASAGLFTLWYAGFQNMIDLGPMQNITLGLSAGAATLSFIFYKQKKNSEIKI